MRLRFSLLTNQLSLLTLRSGLKHEIEISEATLLRVTKIQQQVAAEEEIRGIARFAGKVELRSENRPGRGLEPDMIMPGSTRIDAGEDGVKLVSAVSLTELMPATTKTCEIVLAVRVRMPKVEQRSFYRLSFQIEHKASQGHKNPCYPRFTKVIF